MSLVAMSFEAARMLFETKCKRVGSRQTESFNGVKFH
jgi:hypothetical protein